MRYILQKVRQRQYRNLLDNYYWQLWFRYQNTFFGSLIFAGRKLQAFNMLLKIKQGLKIKELADPLKIFLVSMMMVTPNVYLLPLKLGGRSVGVPLPISEKKKISLGVKFIVKVLKEKFSKLSIKLLVDTLVISIYGKGPSIERKISLYKTSSQNRHLLRKLYGSKSKKETEKEKKIREAEKERKELQKRQKNY